LLKKVLGVLTLSFLALWLVNTSAFTKASTDTELKFLSHRGVHQSFNSTGVGNQDCTAILIEQPTHPYLENTIPSMQAAFDAGADIVELDVHLTPDGHWAVFHDWTLDCRTDGSGKTHKTPMSTLKSLDLGYGYTADDGKSYPLRGTGIGHMPTLSEVLDHFLDRQFLINLKSNNSNDGQTFIDFIANRKDWQSNIWGVYGGPKSVAPVKAAHPTLINYSRKSLKTCLKTYAALGWSGYIPLKCRNTAVSVPINYGKFLWGWPTKFEARLNKAGSILILLGPHSNGNSGTTGIDEVKQLDLIPKGFNGYVWTNKIEMVAVRRTDDGDAN